MNSLTKNPKKHFQLVFGRNGGTPIHVLDHLGSEEIQLYIATISRLKTERVQLKKKLDHSLEKAIKFTEEFEYKRQLIQIKRDLFNDRNISKHLNKSTDQRLNDALIVYDNHNKDLEREISSFEKVYQQLLYASIKNLKGLSDETYFQNGLLFSSHILAAQIQKNNFVFDSLNKKSRKLVLTTLKYLTRSATKTTPFSSFNKVFWYHRTNASVPSVKSQNSYIQINNLVFYYLKKELLENQDFKSSLKVTLNDTIRIKGEDQFHFFLNKNNNESFKNIDKAPILLFIHDFLKKENTFNELQLALVAATSETVEKVASYIDRLVEEGFLMLEYPVNKSDRTWMQRLAAYLSKKNKELFPLQETLEYLGNALTRLEAERDPKKRKTVIENCYRKLRDCFESCNFSTLIFNKLQPQDLFYEDSFSKPPSWEKPISDNALHNSIHNAYNSLNVVEVKKNMLIKLLNISGIEDQQKLPLIDFYEKVYLPSKDRLKIDHSIVQQADNSVLKVLENIHSFSDQKEIDIEPIFSKNIVKKDQSFGAYYQLDANGTIVLNNFSGGNGKSISRFLNFLPAKEVSEIKDAVAYSKKGKLLIDIKDATIHNVNNYPKMTDLIVSLDNDRSLNNTYQSIKLTDLFVKNSSNELHIVDALENPVAMVNCSLEGINRRSKFTKFLDLFDNSDLSGFSFVMDKIKTHYKKELKTRSMVCMPRILFGKNLILSRKTWFAKTSEIKKRFNNHKDHENYLKLTEWVEQHKIPKHVFVKIRNMNDQGINQANDNYKPQFVDFESPLLSFLFFDILKKEGEILEISEMYPTKQDVEQTTETVAEYIMNF